MLPFTEACVPEIDLAGGSIVVEPPRRRDPSRRCRKAYAMWRASVLTIFPKCFPGRSARASPARRWRRASGRSSAIDIRDYATDKHRSVDDTPAGGGPGMVMKADVLGRALDAVPRPDARPRLLMSAARQRR